MDVASISVLALKETSDHITPLNQEQLFAGKNSDGTDIVPEYKETTKEIKRRKSQPTDRVTLKDTGDFYKSIRTTVLFDTVVTSATDEKTPALLSKYGDKILGIGGNYKKIFIDKYLRPNFNKKVEDATGLKFNQTSS